MEIEIKRFYSAAHFLIIVRNCSDMNGSFSMLEFNNFKTLLQRSVAAKYNYDIEKISNDCFHFYFGYNGDSIMDDCITDFLNDCRRLKVKVKTLESEVIYV